MAGDYGFDPFSLGKDPEKLAKYQVNELINARYAMLAVPGMIAVELFGQGNWFDAPLWAVEGRPATYLGVEIPGADIGLVTVIEVVLVAATEVYRTQTDDPEKMKYPGGAFDPLGFAKDANNLETLKLKEIKNGRLAMMAFLGMLAQHKATGKGPLENLADHLSNPLANNVGTNGYSIPTFGL